MEFTVLGSGGCAVIPKPCCTCRVCMEARTKGRPYARTGPALFLHDIDLLVDTPAEVTLQLNRCSIQKVEHLLLTHCDPDHVEGLRVVEQITLDHRTWENYPGRQILMSLPPDLEARLERVCSAYGPLVHYYRRQGYVRTRVFHGKTVLGDVTVTAVPVDRGDQTVYAYVFDKDGKKVVYAPCDIKPFPEDDPVVRGADLLFIQPGMFESGLKHDFVYPQDHISRTTLYTFHETLELARRMEAKETVFVHLEEYWHRSYDDYLELERRFPRIRFAVDGMWLTV